MPDRVPICPICGEECETIKRDTTGDICGCEHCVTDEDAWEWMWAEIREEECVKADYAYDAYKEARCGIA